MKKIITILTIILSTFALSFSAFANEMYDELCEKISGNKFEGELYSPSNSSSPLQFGQTIGDDWTSKTKVTSPKWFKYGNDYYLVLETETDQLTDDNDKKLGLYAITEYVQDEIVIVKWGSNFEAYYFDEDGICGSAITNEKGSKVLFNSDKSVKSGYTPNVDAEDIGLDIYENDDFDGVKGVFDKESKEALYSGYWILDKNNEKYDLYKANDSGTSITVSGATNKSAGDLYTIVNDKKYTTKAVKKSPNSKNSSSNNTSNNANNINNSSTTKSTENTNNSSTTKSNEIKNVNADTSKDIKVTSATNILTNFTIKVKAGKLTLIPKKGKLATSGVYYDKNSKNYYTVDARGKIYVESSQKITNFKEINGEVFDLEGEKYLNILD